MNETEQIVEEKILTEEEWEKGQEWGGAACDECGHKFEIGELHFLLSGLKSSNVFFAYCVSCYQKRQW
ncbi:hypothetical protein [endosymbiont GvMRE of Glomus versiforme]|uniref:hypothetical protein n=1 Tax=endosymbiont GvMRE of Glomus versiforme TaxID=2039283 RepID=UPI000EC8CD6A|nr:hypothetical protein [endosymbiont GvMRE of Glomus versiforme]RHZ36653.1 hypothetical protein GvMRE_I2g96 [endosymbiont GvMRE of Glomus versiforme]